MVFFTATEKEIKQFTKGEDMKAKEGRAKSMNPQVKSLAQLMKLLKKERIGEFFMQLNCGCISRKHISYNKSKDKFTVVNLIDESKQILTSKQMLDEKFSFIGKAIKLGALYFEEYIGEN